MPTEEEALAEYIQQYSIANLLGESTVTDGRTNYLCPPCKLRRVL